MASKAPPSPSLWDGLRELIVDAQTIDIAVAYTSVGGIRVVIKALTKVAQSQGTAIRLLVGNYLGGTRAEAIEQLVVLTMYPNVLVKVITDIAVHFHPKVYRITTRDGNETLFVGSSNLTKDALLGGDDVYEWNLRIKSDEHPRAIAEAQLHIERLFNTLGEVLTEKSAEKICNELRATLPQALLLDRENSPIPEDPIEPMHAQQHALNELKELRKANKRRALVIAATGVGKTILAAFDSLSVVKPGEGKILFVAHRRELLDQASQAFKRVRGSHELHGYVDQKTKDWTCDIVFASVQSLDSAPSKVWGSFNYIVIDEAHHASARSYSPLFQRTSAEFLLGLTATPERTDGENIYELFDGNIACEFTLFDSIERGWLVPFDYVAVPDPVHYERLPWVGGSLGYRESDLNHAVCSENRSNILLKELGKPNEDTEKTLLFCISTAHAEYTKTALQAAGWRVEQVHSKSELGSNRTKAIKGLKNGIYQILVTVDMFNEGVDIPEITRVVLLRPTDSPTVFLQQVGRGLRKHANKSRLKVIDLVGNHKRSMQRLSWLGINIDEVASSQQHQTPTGLRVPLAGGCEACLALEVIDAVKAVADKVRGPGRRLRELIVSWTNKHGNRPTLYELLKLAHPINLSTIRTLFGSWFELLKITECSSADDEQLMGNEFLCKCLEDIEQTDITGPHKMLVLGAMGKSRQFEVPIKSLKDMVTEYAQTIWGAAPVWISRVIKNKDFPMRYPIRVLCDNHGDWCSKRRISNEWHFAIAGSDELSDRMKEIFFKAITERTEARLRLTKKDETT